MLQLQPIQQILGYNTIMASNNETMEVVIRRVGMEDHINIVKLFQVCFSKFTIGIFEGYLLVTLISMVSMMRVPSFVCESNS